MGEAGALGQKAPDLQIGTYAWLNAAEELENQIMTKGDRGVGLLGFQQMGFAGCGAGWPERMIGSRYRAGRLTSHAPQPPPVLHHMQDRIFEFSVASRIEHHPFTVAIAPIHVQMRDGGMGG